MEDGLAAALAARPVEVLPAAAFMPAPPPTPAVVQTHAGEASDAAADDGESPEWPDEAVESAMRAEQRDRDGDGLTTAPRAQPVQATEAEDDAVQPLPQLDALVAQIPSDVRDVLEELFRARFTSVQRVPKAALKQ